MALTAEERFFAKVEKTDSCWLWTAAKDTAGYGRFWNGSKITGAHQWSHLNFVGPIPEGYDVDHLCKVRLCVRPSHLEAVTRLENLLRAGGLIVQNSAKTHCPSGHEYNAINTHYAKTGKKCRVCDREKRRTPNTRIRIN